MRPAALFFGLILALPAGPCRAQIAPEEYASRRAALRAEFGDGLYLARASIGSAGRQDPDFRYLTGCLQPTGTLLMFQAGEEVSETLFLPAPRRGSSFDPAGQGAGEIGRRAGLAVRPLSELESALAAAGTRHPAALISPHPETDPAVEQALVGLRQAGAIGFTNARRTMSDLRAIKSPAEIELLQIASDITRLAHVAAMRTTEPGLNEFEVQAVIEYTFARYGSQRPGFSSIIGSGPNSLVLHYSENTAFMAPEDVVVMDIGAEYFGYTSDVTRTIPVNGTFSQEQRDIYEIVLAANLACARLAETAGTPYQALRDEAQRVIGEGLARIGLIEGPEARIPGQRRSQVGLFFYHGLGHGIGLNVHEKPFLSQRSKDTLENNMVFTIEPGIYIPGWGGVRIEDDVWLKNGKIEVLTRAEK